MIFRCRFVAPRVSAYSRVEAGSAGEAANEFHSWYVPPGQYPSDATRSSLVYVRPGKERIAFANIEIEGQGVTLSRVFFSGIFRRGLKSQDLSLHEIARRLGWDGDPKDLLNGEWAGEESYPVEPARRRLEGECVELARK